MKQVGKELGHIAQLVRLQPMNRSILHLEAFLKCPLEFPVQDAEALADQTVVAAVRSFLAAAVDQHLANDDLFIYFTGNGKSKKKKKV